MYSPSVTFMLNGIRTLSYRKSVIAQDSALIPIFFHSKLVYLRKKNIDSHESTKQSNETATSYKISRIWI